MSGALISAVATGSPAFEAGILVNDQLISVNGRQPTDIIEYQQLIDGESVELLVQRDGEPLQRKFTIIKTEGERLGLSIDSAVFDRIRTCDNHCSFCFIYQLPKGMRRSLYVKDDDFRLSFLYGNYTTLTRFTEFDLERVVEEGLSPLYVSIHTTNPELRSSMLRNPRGATSLRWLRELLNAGIEVHGQVVVCPSINNGAELVRTLDDVVTEYSELATLSLVPIGISAFSTEESMRGHSTEEALEVVELVASYQAFCQQLMNRPLIFASDEYYLLAGVHPPANDSFDSIDLAENGVGLVAAFERSFRELSAMDKLGTGFFQSVDGAPAWGYRAVRNQPNEREISGQRPTVLTGEYAAPLLRSLVDEAGWNEIDIVAVTNDYFGGNIKVAGLLTGTDLRRTIDQVGHDRLYLLPDLCLSEGRFLDGLGLDDLGVNVQVVPTTGVALRETLQRVAPLARASS